MIQKITVDEISELASQAVKISHSEEARFNEFLSNHSLDMSPTTCPPQSSEYRAFWERTRFEILS